MNKLSAGYVRGYYAMGGPLFVQVWTQRSNKLSVKDAGNTGSFVWKINDASP
ncbi:hypothetical protein [Desertivirga xinjiangensis]|uniref:hypothetical protein n=1 Tax=Desertivirga xinjiangensis TaxID=539206 RepID=UPI00210A795C|nr:hypothetical protein [Pedobacter xinjiangensis]